MDPTFVLILVFSFVIPLVALGGWVLTTWMRVRHGYPLDGFGKALYPSSDREAVERVKLLTTENAQLRAEVSALKDRMETIERIVTDQPSKLTREIEALAIDKGGNA